MSLSFSTSTKMNQPELKSKKIKRSLHSRLIRVFALQASMVSLATILGIYAAYTITEQYLVREALKGEKQYYWQQKAKDPDFPLPDTRNMTALSWTDSNTRGVPDNILALPDSYFGRINIDGGEPLIMTSVLNGIHLALVFQEKQVSRLALLFGIAPLSVVLILIYLSSWFTFRQSQKLISPVTQLAKVVDQANIDSNRLEASLIPLIGNNADVDALAKSLIRYANRANKFIERERAFSAYASHELRTPLAVMRGSLDILESQSSLDDKQFKVTQRMRSTVTSMQSLIDILLLIAREPEKVPDHHLEEWLTLNELLPLWIEQMQTAFPEAEERIHLKQNSIIRLQGSEEMLQMVISNLLRNAIQYGGNNPITVTLEQQSLTIEDQGIGMTAEQVDHVFEPFFRVKEGSDGFGLGLALVNTIARRNGWDIALVSTPGQGTKVTLTFP